MKKRLVLIGGFLGAGKTTLLHESARRLIKSGFTVGLVTNDQASDLVDTDFLLRSYSGVREISGSCYCCNFGGFWDAVQSLIREGADIIIAEPVGSCTDLSATILQPIKDKHPEIDLAPFTVLVDPERIGEVLQQKPSLMHESALYIMRLQIQEADLILLNKTDTINTDERNAMIALLHKSFPGTSIDAISARTGEGLESWISAILDKKESGMHLVDVDYDRYAEGEAVLGWLNAIINLESASTTTKWADYGLKFLQQLQDVLKKLKAEIGHVKLMIASENNECRANLTKLGGEIELQGNTAFSGTEARCILNVRVQMPPDELETNVKSTLRNSESDDVTATILSLKCLTPGRPEPTYRYKSVYFFD